MLIWSGPTLPSAQVVGGVAAVLALVLTAYIVGSRYCAPEATGLHCAPLRWAAAAVGRGSRQACVSSPFVFLLQECAHRPVVLQPTCLRSMEWLVTVNRDYDSCSAESAVICLPSICAFSREYRRIIGSSDTKA